MSSTTAQKDPDALLRAIGHMLNEFYGGDDDASTAMPAQVRDEIDAAPATDTSAVVIAAPPSGPAPWDDLEGMQPKGLNLKLDPVLYMKMDWLCHNLPKMSLQKLAKAGTEAEVCWRRSNIDPPHRSKFDPGRGAAF